MMENNDSKWFYLVQVFPKVKEYHIYLNTLFKFIVSKH